MDAIAIIIGTLVVSVVMAFAILSPLLRGERPQVAAPVDATTITLLVFGPCLWATAIGGVVWLRFFL